MSKEKKAPVSRIYFADFQDGWSIEDLEEYTTYPGEEDYE